MVKHIILWKLKEESKMTHKYRWFVLAALLCSYFHCLGLFAGEGMLNMQNTEASKSIVSRSSTAVHDYWTVIVPHGYKARVIIQNARATSAHVQAYGFAFADGTTERPTYLVTGSCTWKTRTGTTSSHTTNFVVDVRANISPMYKKNDRGYMIPYSDAKATFSYDISVTYERICPDLVVSMAQVNTAQGSIDFKIENWGVALTDAVAKVYCDGSCISEPISIGPLERLEYRMFSVALPKLEDGDHVLRVEVDPDDEIDEINEDNNTKEITWQVSAKPSSQTIIYISRWKKGAPVVGLEWWGRRAGIWYNGR